MRTYSDAFKRGVAGKAERAAGTTSGGNETLAGRVRWPGKLLQCPAEADGAHVERLNGVLKREYGLGGHSGRRPKRGGRYGRRSFCTTSGGLMPRWAAWRRRRGAASQWRRKIVNL